MVLLIFKIDIVFLNYMCAIQPILAWLENTSQMKATLHHHVS